MKKLLALCLCFVFVSCHAEEFIVRHGDRTQKRIAITVDDCYDGQHIQSIVELCEAYGVVVTFFPIGNALKFADAPIWQRAVEIGCELGNHTWGHKNMTNLNAQEVRFAMLRTQQKVDELLGYHYPMQVMRPPLGKLPSRHASTLQSLGYQHAVLWDVSQTDAKQALKSVQNGSILLYHGRKKDVNCLKSLIPALLDQGYELVTVSELLGLPPVETSPEIYVYSKGD